MINYIFSADNNNIIVKKNDVVQKNIDTNMTTFDSNDYQKRLIADLIKDANENPPVFEIEKKLKCIFDGSVIDNLLSNGNNYKKILDLLKKKVDQNDNITKKIEIYNNILKTTTVGSNTKISDAQLIFQESGMTKKQICRMEANVITTPGSLLDTLSKTIEDDFFPEINTSITFDSSFTNRLGFPPGFEWSVNTTENKSWDVSIKYNGDTVKITDTITPTAKFGINNNFSPYSKGNALKNTDLNDINSTDDKSCEEIMKILLTKEMGDVAQVWLYFAYFYINNNVKKENVLMITTDNVVFLFCVLLNISCVYTGARKGVVRGACTLNHYLAGEISYKIKLKNILKNNLDRVVAHNNALVIGLSKMIINLDNFKYYRIKGSGIILTYGEFNITNSITKSDIKKLFKKNLDEINKKTLDLNTEYSKYINDINNRDEDDIKSKIDTILKDATDFFESQRHEQIITQIKKGSYILQNSDLLNSFINLVNEGLLKNNKIIDPIIVPTNEQIIKSITNETTIKRGGTPRSSRKNYETNNDPSYYYEYLILFSIFYNLKYDGTNIQPDYHIISFIYDFIVSNSFKNKNIEKIIGKLFNISNFSFDEIFDKFTDEEIINKGSNIEKNIYLETKINFDDEAARAIETTRNTELYEEINSQPQIKHSRQPVKQQPSESNKRAYTRAIRDKTQKTKREQLFMTKRKQSSATKKNRPIKSKYAEQLAFTNKTKKSILTKSRRKKSTQKKTPARDISFMKGSTINRFNF